jgi:predicted metalloprotease
MAAMRWQGRRESSNVEDRRGRSSGMRMGVGGGIGGLALLLLVSWFTGADPGELMSSLQQPASSTQSDAATPPADDNLTRFMRVVLADTEDTWTEIFRAEGVRYEPPRLVLFTDATESACGVGQSAMGPFYCPADRKVYLDLSFFAELDTRFGAPGDFAQAYVVAHEVGHHIQTLAGIMEQRAGGGNAASVRIELQADCYAGVWGHFAARRGMVDDADVEEGLAAAAAIGDDRMQRQSGGRVSPESFTHGSSAQRVEWFRRGLTTGRPDTCDTFAR